MDMSKTETTYVARGAMLPTCTLAITPILEQQPAGWTLKEDTRIGSKAHEENTNDMHQSHHVRVRSRVARQKRGGIIDK